MAEAICRHLGGDKFESLSAGLEPQAQIHPLAIKVMAEIGIDIAAQQPKSVKQFLGKESILVFVVLCSKEDESCPRIWPGISETRRFHWPLDNPEELSGSEDELIPVLRSVRDQLLKKIHRWLKSDFRKEKKKKKADSCL